MLRLFALLSLALTSADHWTTWFCLRSPVPGWNVSEANPLASWLFDSAGLVPGLVIDSLITVAAVGFLVTTRALPRRAKLGFLALISTCTGYAVLNNVLAIQDMGLLTAGAY